MRLLSKGVAVWGAGGPCPTATFLTPLPLFGERLGAGGWTPYGTEAQAPSPSPHNEGRRNEQPKAPSSPAQPRAPGWVTSAAAVRIDRSVKGSRGTAAVGKHEDPPVPLRFPLFGLQPCSLKRYLHMTADGLAPSVGSQATAVNAAASRRGRSLLEVSTAATFLPVRRHPRHSQRCCGGCCNSCAFEWAGLGRPEGGELKARHSLEHPLPPPPQNNEHQPDTHSTKPRLRTTHHHVTPSRPARERGQPDPCLKAAHSPPRAPPRRCRRMALVCQRSGRRPAPTARNNAHRSHISPIRGSRAQLKFSRSVRIVCTTAEHCAVWKREAITQDLSAVTGAVGTLDDGLRRDNKSTE
ncbi:hypothetical protein AAFF_G00304840 [Aldrovandia affinis]|uniref:Uncharacterized protein n=1 Tax=Aldrovandia affinis TaxID=143900 RepID=A0AAD7SPJ7_9TELE|nr:hypothetical protein AAFF_G00304840 [Aldrovandia affinis]